MKKIFLVLSFFYYVSCGGYGVGPQEGYSECSFRTDRGFVVKWKELPIPVYVHQSVSPLAQENYIYAIDIWNEAWNYHTGQGPLFEFIAITDTETIPRADKEDPGDEINILYVDRDHRLLSSGTQGTTHVRNYFMGSIYEADIIINNVHFKYFYEEEPINYAHYTKVPPLSTQRALASTSPLTFWKKFLYGFQKYLNFLTFWKKKAPRLPAKTRRINKDKVDFISLSLHELGHAAGLAHTDDSESVMYPSLPKGMLRRDIRKIETDNLYCEYGP